jgi:hypothetical protein
MKAKQAVSAQANLACQVKALKPGRSQKRLNMQKAPLENLVLGKLN